MKRAVLIDSRPSFDGRPAALLPFAGGALIERHLRLARSLGGDPIYILEEEAHPVSGSLPQIAGKDVKFVSREPQGEYVRLSTLHIYKEGAAKVIWTLRGADDVKNAQGEIERSGFFTISKHTLRPMGRAFAAWAFKYTPLTGNHLTWARILTGLLGAWLFYKGGAYNDMLAGVCVLTSWFFDLTDGQLARLRGEVSKFGAYLDSVGDGVVDNLYYVALAASAWNLTGENVYVWLGFAFLFGKYVFVNSTLLAPREFLGAQSNPSVTGGDPFAGLSAPRRFAKRLFSLLDETDVRIHLLAVCAILAAPLAALVFHAVYFNLRWVLNLVNAYWKLELKKERA